MADLQDELQKKVSQLQRETTKLRQAKQVVQVTEELEQLEAQSRAQLVKLKFQHSQALSAKELELRQVKLDLLGGGVQHRSRRHTTKRNIKDRIGPKAGTVQVQRQKKPLTTKARRPTSRQVDVKPFKQKKVQKKKKKNVTKIQKKVQKKKKNS